MAKLKDMPAHLRPREKRLDKGGFFDLITELAAEFIASHNLV